MEPIEYYRALRNWWWVVAAAVLLGFVAAWVTAPSSTKEYEATRTLIVDADETTVQSEFALDRLAFRVTNGEVPERAAEQIGFDDHPSELAEQIETAVDSTVQTITIAAIDGSPDVADELADTFALQLQATVDADTQEDRDAATAKVDQLQGQINQVEAQIGTLPEGSPGRVRGEAQLASLLEDQEEAKDAAAVPPPFEFETVPPTEAVVVSAGPDRLQRMGLAGLVGLLLGVGLALLCARFDPRIRTKEQAQRAFGLPVLAEIPVLPRRRRNLAEIVTVSDPESLAGQAYRSLRTSLLLKSAPRHLAGVPTATSMRVALDARFGRGEPKTGPQVVVVASPGMAEGKTTTTANLAAAFAETGRRVLVLECDLRRPTIGRYLGVDEGPGLSDALAQSEGEIHLEEFIRATSIPKVRVVTAGRPVASPDELLTRIANVINAARQYADVVVVDTAPLLATDDASVLVPMADDVVLICRAGRTPVDAAERATELLTRLGASLDGVVIVGATVLPTARGYYRADHRFWQSSRQVVRKAEAKPEPNGAKSPVADRAGGPTDTSAGAHGLPNEG
jgi:capsular exopolysaccharide synthesis family protein